MLFNPRYVNGKVDVTNKDNEILKGNNEGDKNEEGCIYVFPFEK